MTHTAIDRFGLYAILTNPLIGYKAAAEAAVSEGVRYLQLRIKDKPAHEIREIAAQVAAVTRGSRTRFIMNDDVHIAMDVDADGVHLGQGDMDIDEARRLWNKSGKIYGLSTHNHSQAAQASLRNPDYIGVGPVFATPTKAIPDPVLGLETMQSIIESVSITTVAIGGIDESNLPDVLAYGAVNFCAVRAIMQSRTPEAVIRRMLKTWSEASGSAPGI